MSVRPKAPYKPRIFYHGLALVLIPCLLGTILLLWLKESWSSSAEALNEETQQSKIVRKLNDAFAVWGTSVARVIDKSLQSAGRSAKINDLMETRSYFCWTEYEVRNDPRALSNLKRLEKVYMAEAETLMQMPELKTTESVDLEAVQKLPALLARLYKLRTEVGNLLQVESTQLNSVRERGDRARTSFRYILYGCCLGNIALAIVLCCLFAGSITWRLAILMNNANCLPKNQKFPDRVKGNDELAYLDTVLADAAAQLEAAAEHRRSIIGMVAHDMRSPLMAAQASLQMIEELGVSFSDQAFRAFDRSYKNLSGILVFVKELLSVQKQGQAATEESSDPGQTGGDSGTEPPPQALINKPAPETAIQPAHRQSLPSLAFCACRDFITRPKVLQQGLLLVMVPLLFQTAILLVVNHEILKSENLATRARHLNDSMMDAQTITIKMVRASISQAIYVFTGKPKFQELARKIFREIDDQLSHMNAATGPDDAEALRLLQESRQVITSQRERILAISPSDSPASMVKVFEDISEVHARSPQAYQLRRASTQRRIRERVKLAAMEDERNEAAQAVSDYFGWSIVANFLVAAGLLIVFKKKISQRLDILVGNATRLGKREPMRNEVKGSDEFASLDLCLHHAEAQINEASALRAEMMSSLALDMRRPLQDSQQGLQRFRALTGDSLPDRCLNLLTKSQRNIDRVLSLIENLLTIESLSTGKVHLETRICDTAKVAEEALGTVSSLAQKKSIGLKNECAAVSIKADGEKLVQVLVNLLGNAIKFSPANTTIKILSEEKKEFIRLAVQDQGPGMNEETKASVFEKFYQAQTAEKEQGFGLGLAICKLIVESHGGVIGVESEPGKGTTFWFDLPRNGPPISADTQAR